MPEIIASAEPAPMPVEIIREAAAAARASGLYVYPGDHGVRVISSTGLITWGTDDERTRVVSPFGAVLLNIQPQETDFYAALRMSLGACQAYVEAFEYGFEVKVPPPGWADRWVRRPDVWQLLIAYTHGNRYRTELIGPRTVGGRS